MYLVNRFGRVVHIQDKAIAERKLKSGRLREATKAEIKVLEDKRRASAIPGDVYYQSVRQAPDGYGMSRDHLQNALQDEGVFLSETFNSQRIGLLYNQPYSLLQMPTDARLIYTMFESTKLPEDWPDLLKAADEVIVPSKWCHEIFLRSGIQSTVVPLGYNSDVFKRVPRDVPAKTDKPFTFIHYDSFNVRKGFMEVFQAFTQEFTADEPVRLILKTVRQSVSIPIVKAEFPQIEVVRGSYSEHELFELLGQAHCMVYPSRGEGFGITPLEAMATGLPAIVPNAHGISEYFDSRYMLEVDVADTCPGLYTKFRGQDVGEMVICDVDHLRKQMRWAFEHQAEAANIGTAAAFELAPKYTYKQSAKKLAAVINAWRQKEIIKRRDSKYLQVVSV